MKKLLAAGILSVVAAVASGLVWVGILTAIFSLAFFFLLRPVLQSESMGQVAHAVAILIFVCSLALVLRVVAFDVYQITGASMENTLFNGDRIIISKLSYGPVLPFEIADDEVRLEGNSEIKRNDIVVFRLKSEQRPVVKRIVAVAGDTINIKNLQLYLGHRRVADPALSKRMYLVWHNNMDSIYRHLVAEKIESFYDGRKKCFLSFMTSQQRDSIVKTSFVDSLRSTSSPFLSSEAKTLFHNENELNWDINNIGPLVVPKKGLKISLDQINFIIYHNTILLDENADLRYNNGKFTIDDSVVTSYTFKYDYYYVLGDNYNKSLDSRQHGFVKGDDVVGKAVVLLHRSENKFHDSALWGRLE